MTLEQVNVARMIGVHIALGQDTVVDLYGSERSTCITLNAIGKTEKKKNAKNSICDQASSDNVVEVTPAT